MSDGQYWLSELTLSGFRAYLNPQTFKFDGKQNLAIFAPNGSGKSSLVDALDFLLSEDGSLLRLGLKKVNNQAGIEALAHNRAGDKKIIPGVTIVAKRGKDRPAGTRKASGSQRPRPAIADDLRRCHVVDPIVRGHALRAFVETQTPEERYEEVAGWLQFGPLVGIQKALRGLRQRAKAAAEDESGTKRVDQQVAKRTSNALNKWGDDEALEYANRLIAGLDPTLKLSGLTKQDPAFKLLTERKAAEEKQVGLEGLRQMHRAAQAIHAVDTATGVVTGQLHELDNACQEYATKLSVERAEQRAAADAVFKDLWDAAGRLFAEGQPLQDTCPVCGTRIELTAGGSIQGIRDHLKNHQEGLTRYSIAKKGLDEASRVVTRSQIQLVAGLKAVVPLLSTDHKAQLEAMGACLKGIEAWKVGEPLLDVTELRRHLEEIASGTGKTILEIETRQGDSTYARVLRDLEELVDLREEWVLALRTRMERVRLQSSLDGQAEYISAEIRRRVQKMLDSLQEPINTVYKRIQRDRALPIRLELPAQDDTNQQRLMLVVDFDANRVGVQPAGYLSDSQVHSLALALRLVAIRKFNVDAPLVVLDDIVTSYDADHRRTIAGLFVDEFSKLQVILTTHDERFFLYLRDQVGDAAWQFKRITELDRDFGPKFTDQKVSDDMIESRWKEGESAANEMRQAEEEWLLGLCRDFGVELRIRPIDRPYAFERSELAAALSHFLKTQKLVPSLVPGVANRFLGSLQVGAIENFGSHFQDNPYGVGSIGDEQARWEEFKAFREQFRCPVCARGRFKRPLDMARPVCAHGGCEAQFSFGSKPDTDLASI